MKLTENRGRANLPVHCLVDYHGIMPTPAWRSVSSSKRSYASGQVHW